MANLYPSTVDLQREVISRDASGGQSRTWSTVTSGIDLDIQPASSSVMLQYKQNHLNVTHTLYFSSDCGAKATDRFLNGTRIFKIHGYRPPNPAYDEWPGVADVEEVVT